MDSEKKKKIVLKKMIMSFSLFQLYKVRVCLASLVHFLLLDTKSIFFASNI